MVHYKVNYRVEKIREIKPKSYQKQLDDKLDTIESNYIKLNVPQNIIQIEKRLIEIETVMFEIEKCLGLPNVGNLKDRIIMLEIYIRNVLSQRAAMVNDNLRKKID
jgi:hypothetical protein